MTSEGDAAWKDPREDLPTTGVKPKNNSFDNGMFVHSWVDDSDMSVYEFRVYGHLCRRGGDTARSFEGVINMAAYCRMSERQVRDCLRTLEQKGWIRREMKVVDGIQRPSDIIILGHLVANRGTLVNIGQHRESLRAEKASKRSAKHTDSDPPRHLLHPPPRHTMQGVGAGGADLEGIPSEGNPITKENLAAPEVAAAGQTQADGDQGAAPLPSVLAESVGKAEGTSELEAVPSPGSAAPSPRVKVRDAAFDALAPHVAGRDKAGVTSQAAVDAAASQIAGIKKLLKKSGIETPEEITRVAEFIQTTSFVNRQASIKKGSWEKFLPDYLTARDTGADMTRKGSEGQQEALIQKLREMHKAPATSVRREKKEIPISEGGVLEW